MNVRAEKSCRRSAFIRVRKSEVDVLEVSMSPGGWKGENLGLLRMSDRLVRMNGIQKWSVSEGSS